MLSSPQLVSSPLLAAVAVMMDEGALVATGVTMVAEVVAVVVAAKVVLVLQSAPVRRQGECSQMGNEMPSPLLKG